MRIILITGRIEGNFAQSTVGETRYIFVYLEIGIFQK